MRKVFSYDNDALPMSIFVAVICALMLFWCSCAGTDVLVGGGMIFADGSTSAMSGGGYSDHSMFSSGSSTDLDDMPFAFVGLSIPFIPAEPPIVDLFPDAPVVSSFPSHERGYATAEPEPEDDVSLAPWWWTAGATLVLGGGYGGGYWLRRRRLATQAEA